MGRPAAAPTVPMRSPARSTADRPAGMAAAMSSRWEESNCESPFAPAPASRPSTPRITGASMPRSERTGSSPRPANLPIALASEVKELDPSKEDSRLLPVSASCAGPLLALARFSSVRGDCLAMASASRRSPSGLEASFARPERIAGTAAATAVCAVARSEMPNADAILATRSGVKTCDTADTIFPCMASSSLFEILRGCPVT